MKKFTVEFIHVSNVYDRLWCVLMLFCFSLTFVVNASSFVRKSWMKFIFLLVGSCDIFFNNNFKEWLIQQEIYSFHLARSLCYLIYGKTKETFLCEYYLCYLILRGLDYCALPIKYSFIIRESSVCFGFQHNCFKFRIFTFRYESKKMCKIL